MGTRVRSGRRWKARVVTLSAVAVSVLTLFAGRTAVGITTSTWNRDLRHPRGFAVVAAGDIACDPLHPAFNGGRGRGAWCRAAATARVARRLEPDAVLTLGDQQYDDGRGRAYRQSFDVSWGVLRARTFPVPGNHEYWDDGDARGYFSYFGARAGSLGEGWYSFEAGEWHVVALNSNCDRIACGPRSRQVRWLRTDLAANPALCTLAFMHHPLVSSGPHGDDPHLTGALWDTLYAAGVDVALAGHDHLYERFAPLRPDLTKDPTTGIRTFVVGTGGVQHYEVEQRKASSQQVSATTFGVVRLVLRSGSYRWRFVPAAGGDYRDAGTGTCHDPAA